VLELIARTVGPVALACCFAGVAANCAQVGWHPALKALTPSFGKLNPVSGFKNLFGSRFLFELPKILAKTILFAAIAALSLVPQITHMQAAVGTPPGPHGQMISSGIAAIAERGVAVFLLIAVADFIYQRRKFEKNLKMTKQEVKDEAKQQDLPPEIKGALRRRMLQLARQRMMAAVPEADMVVTNPTHYAVALKYDGSKPAPVLVAKGKGHVALQIREIATENDVPLVPNPPLARQIFRDVELDQMIPADLYAAVAQVLAFVFRTAGRKKRR
jgi:flagellar biosynthetic protein FlhB